MNEQDNASSQDMPPIHMVMANPDEWIAPIDYLREAVIHYLHTYGDSPSRTLTHMRRELKVILAAYNE